MIRASCQCDVPCPPTRDDMSSLTSVTSEAQGVLVSRPVSPEHPSISSYTSTCLLECGRLCNLQLCSRDSGKLYLQADAGATESFARSDADRRAINESLAFKVAYTTSHATARSGRTNDIANAPFFGHISGHLHTLLEVGISLSK